MPTTDRRPLNLAVLLIALLAMYTPAASRPSRTRRQLQREMVCAAENMDCTPYQGGCCADLTCAAGQDGQYVCVVSQATVD